MRLNKPEDIERTLEIVLVEEGLAPIMFKTYDRGVADNLAAMLDGYYRLSVNLHGTIIEVPKPPTPPPSPKPVPKAAPAPPKVTKKKKKKKEGDRET
mgnify:CR=1 FL=1